MKREVFICKCDSVEHQLSFWYDKEENELHCEPHLSPYKNFFKRCAGALKYIFGYRSKYGDWDCMIFKNEDLVKLKSFLDESIN